MLLAGRLEVQAQGDLRGLGPREGRVASYAWVAPNLLPHLLAWMGILLLLAQKSNRRGQAWWICAPLGVWFAACTVLQANSDETFQELVFQVINAGGFSAGALWLVMGTLGPRHRMIRFFGSAFVIGAMGLLAVASAAWDEFLDNEELRGGMVVCWLAIGLAGALAFVIAKRIARHAFRPVRVGLGLFFGLLVSWLLAGAVLIAITPFFGYLTLESFVSWVLAAVLISFLTLLPFLVLSSVNGWYRQRLKSWFELETPETSAPAPTVPAVEKPGAKS